MRARILLLALFAVPAAPAVGLAVNKDKLRKAAALPVLSIVAGASFNATHGFVLSSEVLTSAQELAALEKALVGDASDAERLCRLGDLTFKSDPERSRRCYERAENLCREQIRAHPEDVRWRLRLADVLNSREQYEQAAALYRQAVKDAPGDWRCWLALAGYLDESAGRAVQGNGRPSFSSPQEFLRSLLAANLTAGKVAEWERWHKEATDCFDRAIALGPTEAEPYRRRAFSRWWSSILHCALSLTRGERADPAAAFLTPDCLSDFRQAVRRAPDDYPGIAVLALFELMTAASAWQGKVPDKPFDALAPDVREWLQGALKRLEKGMEDKDHHRAAQSAEVLGLLHMLVLADQPGAEGCFQRAVALDPAREHSWDVLTASLTGGDRFEENLRLCQRRLKHIDSAHSRLMLAKAYEWTDQLDKAEEQVRAALAKEPDDCLANIALASLLMKHDSPADLKKASEALKKAYENSSQELPGENRAVNYAIACVIYNGLIGQVASAREGLEWIQKRDPKNEQARKILEALDE